MEKQDILLDISFQDNVKRVFILENKFDLGKIPSRNSVSFTFSSKTAREGILPYSHRHTNYLLCLVHRKKCVCD